ncbi:hypothetical protein HGI30_16745 [Paenibacillus albicereus]|uniref:Uncharacterized protein n=1 Tax=Paenibacillus albicereus TaxID=2726185 RepID=A0A6H2H421_9BACL|nr:hypothetical protein HGI30_16745 [Paenibacillus albicereus]
MRGHVQPAGGKLLAEMYGLRAAYMRSVFAEPGQLAVSIEGFGVWLNVPSTAAPDYKVVAVRPWGGHTVIDMEVWGRG